MPTWWWSCWSDAQSVSAPPWGEKEVRVCWPPWRRQSRSLMILPWTCPRPPLESLLGRRPHQFLTLFGSGQGWKACELACRLSWNTKDPLSGSKAVTNDKVSHYLCLCGELLNLIRFACVFLSSAKPAWFLVNTLLNSAISVWIWCIVHSHYKEEIEVYFFV